MKKSFLLVMVLCLVIVGNLVAQPWLQPLLIRTSVDGTNFGSPQVFQDSSGVPSVIRLTNGTLICAFQWFPAPVGSVDWDSIAVKTSTDNGLTWSTPTSVNITGIPVGYQRPFDPTLVETDSGQIRMYFSCGPIGMGLDSNIDTHSAISNDGINYVFESGPRFGSTNDPVIDPACVKFNGTWHYTAPIGAPQDGAHHATSTDGFNYSATSAIPSDMSHNWTGNLMVDSNEMRFYGAGATIWYNSTLDGTVWNGYTNTNVYPGGDPSVVKMPDGNYIMIYVGPPGFTGVEDEEPVLVNLYPNPGNDYLHISCKSTIDRVEIIDVTGKNVKSLTVNQINPSILIEDIAKGMYWVRIFTHQGIHTRKWMKD